MCVSDLLHRPSFPYMVAILATTTADSENGRCIVVVVLEIVVVVVVTAIFCYSGSSSNRDVYYRSVTNDGFSNGCNSSTKATAIAEN